MTTTARSGYRFLACWHALALILILVLPVLKYRTPLWALAPQEIIQIGLLAAGYAVSVLATTMLAARGRHIGPAASAVALASAYGLVFFLILLLGYEFSRLILLGIVVGSLGLVVFAHVPSGLRSVALPLLALVAVGAIVMSYMRIQPRTMVQAEELDPEADYYETIFYRLKAKGFANRIPMPEASAGAIAPIGDRYLLATGDGSLYLFHWTGDDGSLVVEPLPNRIHLNIAGFRRDLAPGLDPRRLRLTDVLVQESGDAIRVFAAHLFWHDEGTCAVMRISALEASRDAFMSGRADAEFETLFESTPCLPFKERFTRFSMQHGGRLLLYDDSTLLLTIGDHDFNGLNSDEPLAQQETNSYGKTLLVPMATQEAAQVAGQVGGEQIRLLGGERQHPQAPQILIGVPLGPRSGLGRAQPALPVLAEARDPALIPQVQGPDPGAGLAARHRADLDAQVVVHLALIPAVRLFGAAVVAPWAYRGPPEQIHAGGLQQAVHDPGTQGMAELVDIGQDVRPRHGDQ